ncbi:MAG: peptidoglycan-binding protein [Clostridia bacterium]|nr:peptidoglycan-binding protein [Clostridia bacterium]
MPLPGAPFVPDFITVHLGPPDSDAENVTVSFPYYIKNVASSEIYPTWEESAIYANIYAQISYALNRVYTEFYRSRGYNFDITSSTAYDQKFIRGRNIYENIDRIVDDIFTSYIRRQGFIEPLAAKYCNGTTVTCEGLSQWGSQELAKDGLNSFEILQNYYGNDIELVQNAPISGILNLYPGNPVRLGDTGEDVYVVQQYLNEISTNYPAIPKISPIDGIFGEATENAVTSFQRIFNLTPDGIVGEATWNKMTLLYVAVRRLAELNSEGQQILGASIEYISPSSLGDEGAKVSYIQYFLGVISQFDPRIPYIEVTGVFDEATQNAVQEFQRAYSLDVTGVVDRATWDVIYNTYETIAVVVLSNITYPSDIVGLTQFPGNNLSVGDNDN